MMSKISINGEFYETKLLSINAQELTRKIEAVDLEVLRLKNQIAIAQTARNLYVNQLVNAVSKPSTDDKHQLNFPLSKGQRGLFIDCGGYDGCSAVKFIIQNPSFDSISFEPNPVLWACYSDVPTTLVKKAAYTHKGTVTFRLDETDADGSSLIESKKVDYLGKIKNDECPKITVECFDVAELIRKASKIYEVIILKLDIEGAEYDVLEHLIKQDLICHIKKIYAEFHWTKCGFPEKRHWELLDKLSEKTSVGDWDALDYSIFTRSEDAKNQRANLINSRFSDIPRRQNLKIVDFLIEP